MRGPFSDIRPQERRATLAAFLILFGILAGHAIQETARDALFLASIPPSSLAWVYLAIAGASAILYFLQERRGKTGRTALAVWLFVSAGINAAFWVLVLHPSRLVLFTQYIWTGVFSTLVVVRFWTLTADLFTVAQAKRVFSLIGAGGALGAIVGSAGAGALATVFPARHLLLGSAAVLAATAACPVLLMPRAAADRSEGAGTEGRRRARFDLFGPLRITWNRLYLRLVAGIILVSFVSLTLVDYIFKSTMASHFPPDRLGMVFGWSYLAFNGLSLIAQVFLVGWLVRVLGVSRVLSILPSLVVLGTAGILAGGGVVAAFVAKAFDGGLRNSLHRTAIEVLFVPLSTDLRGRIKGLIDSLGQRGGQALASVLILLLSLTAEPELMLAGIALVLAGVWIRLGFSLKKHYLNLFRESLSEVSLRTRIEFPELDLESLESLMASLNSPNDREVLAAVDLLEEQERGRLLPALLLYHPSTRVVIRSLEVFSRAGRTDFIPITVRILEHDNPELRAAALRALAWVAPDPDVYGRFLDDPAPMVRATALIGQVSYGTLGAEEAEERLYECAGSGTPEERLALARAIRFSPGAAYEGFLLLLAESHEVEIQHAAAEAMREIRSPHFIPGLLAMLPDRHLRRTARDALVSIGVEALEQLEESLANPHLNREIRLQVPRTIARFEPTRAAGILVRHLATVREGSVRYRIMKALTRLREAQPDLELDAAVLASVLGDNLRAAFRLVHWRYTMERGNRWDPTRNTRIQALISALLAHKEVQTVERIFVLLGLIHPAHDVRAMYRGLNSGNRSLHASSLELLEDMLEGTLRDAVIALVDDVSRERKLLRAGPHYTPARLDYVELMRALLERPGIGMRTLVIYHIGELGLSELRPDLERLPSDLSGLVYGEVERTLRLLEEKARVADGR